MATLNKLASKLEADNDVSIGGLVAVLGPRRIPQRNHQAALKRKASKERRREGANGQQI